MTSVMGTALITGASSGMGAIYADRLARRGYDLIRGARGRESLKSVADAIAAATGRATTPVRADLGNPEDLRRVESILRMESYRQSNIPHLQYMHQRAVGSDREDAYV